MCKISLIPTLNTAGDTFNELIVLAHDEELWKGIVESIYKRKPKRSRQDRRSELISTL